ncbi:hypothetical protein ACWDA9_27770, partial [Streptomyces sp. NPDC001193]
IFMGDSGSMLIGLVLAAASPAKTPSPGATQRSYQNGLPRDETTDQNDLLAPKRSSKHGALASTTASFYPAAT